MRLHTKGCELFAVLRQNVLERGVLSGWLGLSVMVGTVVVSMAVQAYRFALDPGPGQEAALRSHCGAQRYAYNWGLGRVRANLGQRTAEKSYGLSGDELTPSFSWSAYGLRKGWNTTKREVAPWWGENSKEAYSSGLANLAAALKNWGDSMSGKRRGRGVGFPRFKGKRAGLSCRFTTGAFGLVEADRRHVRLPRIGVVRTHDATRAGAQVLAVPTNNAWFGRTEMTYQQLAMSRIRAVENGRAVVVAATSGVSAIVQPDGTVTRDTGQYTAETLVEEVPLRSSLTLATKLGSSPEWVFTAVGLSAWVLAWRRRARRATATPMIQDTAGPSNPPAR